jgi:1-acyl-sn-glycerol-3-phosphate acyltransferase
MTVKTKLQVFFRTILAAIAAAILSFLLGPGLLLANAFTKSGLPGHWVAVVWCLGVSRLGGITASLVCNRELDPSASYLIVSNHQGYADILALRLTLPFKFRWVIKKELLKIPFFGWGLGATGAIAIDRSDAKQAKRDLVNAANKIGNGWSVLIYPEGTRTRDGSLLPFKRGGFLMAIHSEATILPVTINGAHLIMRKNSLKIRPGHITVTVGDPISTEGLTEDDIGDLAKETRAAISRNLDPNYDPFRSRQDLVRPTDEPARNSPRSSS